MLRDGRHVFLARPRTGRCICIIIIIIITSKGIIHMMVYRLSRVMDKKGAGTMVSSMVRMELGPNQLKHENFLSPTFIVRTCIVTLHAQLE